MPYPKYRRTFVGQYLLFKTPSGKLKLKAMNTTSVKGNWDEQKGKLKQAFANLTDDDLLFAEGKKDEMMGRLEIKLGKTKEELHKIISAV
jgi:uncharacterized protein YjbJ (UPF0337 family)